MYLSRVNFVLLRIYFSMIPRSPSFAPFMPSRGLALLLFYSIDDGRCLDHWVKPSDPGISFKVSKRPKLWKNTGTSNH